MKYDLYKNHFTLTKDLHSFYINLKLILSLIRFFFATILSYIIWELIMIRPISINYKHRFEERITKKRLDFLLVYFVIEF